MYKFCPNPKHLIGLWKNECLASSNPSMNQRTELRFDLLLNSLLVVWVLPIWPPSETREKEQERGRKREIERKRREKGRKGKEKGWRKDFLKEYQQKLGLPNIPSQYPWYNTKLAHKKKRNERQRRYKELSPGTQISQIAQKFWTLQDHRTGVGGVGGICMPTYSWFTLL